MIEKLTIASLESDFCYELWLTSAIKDFREFWPSTHQSHAARYYAFQCADILELKCKTIAVARNVTPLFVAIVDRTRKPVMLIPLAIERRHGVRILMFLDGGLSDYNSPIVFPSAREWRVEDVRVLWRGLRAILPPFDVAFLERMPDKIENERNPLLLLGASRSSFSGHAATLCEAWDDFVQKRLPRRRTLRRYRRRLEERGKLTFEIAKTNDEIEAFLETLISQKIRHQHETFTTVAFDDPGYRRFVENMTHSPSMAGTVHLSALKLDGAIIAAHWGYVVGRRFYYLIPTYDSGPLRSFAPGHLLIEHLLEWSIDNGIALFDFGYGDEGYKLEYCDVVIALHMKAIPVTAKGLAYYLVTSLWERLKRCLRQTRIGWALKVIIRGGPLLQQWRMRSG